MDATGFVQPLSTRDFRSELRPSRAWILGEDADRPGRIELLRMAEPREAMPASATTVPPAAVASDCVCPEFCERDHANE